MKINPKKTALIIVDMQDCFCKPGGSLYNPRCKRIINKLEKFRGKMKDRGVKIIYTQDWHSKKQGKHYRQSQRWGHHCLAGTEEAKIIEELKPEKDDYVVKKKTYSGFYDTNLEKCLKRKNIDTVLITGALTNVCVLHTASEAALRDLNVIVLEDLTEALNQKGKKNALEHIDWLFGKVLKSSSIQ